MTDVGVAVLAAAEGDSGAWDVLIERFARLIWAIARSMGLSVADADDVSQTTWLKLAEHLTNLRDPERVGLWLAVTARNESLRILRRANRNVPFDPLAEVRRYVSGNEVDLRILEKERDQALWRAFQALPSSCRVLLLMLTAEPAFSYEEVSASLSMPVGSIGPTRGRCLERLRNHPELKACVGGEQAITLRRTAS
ncbi:MAG: RNA polymerase sigma factor [Acidimicrobiales bacterium]